jgi:hypothetical protein
VKRAVVTVTGQAGNASAEYVIATLPPVPLPGEAGGVLLSNVVIDGFINYTTAVATTLTALTLRVRRNSLVGTQIGPNQTITVTNTVSTYAIPIAANDPIIQGTPPVIPGQVYVVTLVQVGTGLVAGTTNYAVVTATTS